MENNNVQDTQISVEQGVVIKIADGGLEIVGVGQVDKATTASIILNATAVVMADIEDEAREVIIEQILSAAKHIAESVEE